MSGFKVQSKMCDTCIYRPDSPLDLEKLEADVADPHMEGFFRGHRVCHHSKDACCRGFWEAHKDQFTMGQMAQRLNCVEFVDEDELPTKRQKVESRNQKLKRLKSLAEMQAAAKKSAEPKMIEAGPDTSDE